MNQRKNYLEGPLLTPPFFVDINEAARLLSVGRTSIYEYFKTGDLHSVKQGRRTVVLYAELEALAYSLSLAAGIK